MRKCVISLLAGVAGVTLAAAAASAADLPSPAAPPAPIIAAPIFTWTGFYAGVQRRLGLARARPADRRFSAVRCPGTLNFANNSDGGFTGGGQIGYNYQIGSFVIGVETDIQWADTDQN